jgi:carbonic anhydrase
MRKLIWGTVEFGEQQLAEYAEHSERSPVESPSAVLAPGTLDDTLNLTGWLHHARPAATRLAQDVAPGYGLPPYDRLSQLNVLLQLEHLMTYPDVRTAVERGALQLSGGWFDIAGGDMYVYQPDARTFAVIDRDLAERLVGED